MKEIAKLRRMATKQGWTVEETGSGHLSWRSPNGGSPIVTSSTPGSDRALREDMNRLASAGLSLDGTWPCVCGKQLPTKRSLGQHKRFCEAAGGTPGKGSKAKVKKTPEARPVAPAAKPELHHGPAPEAPLRRREGESVRQALDRKRLGSEVKRAEQEARDMKPPPPYPVPPDRATVAEILIDFAEAVENRNGDLGIRGAVEFTRDLDATVDMIFESFE